jgi:hypothetical protein
MNRAGPGKQARPQVQASDRQALDKFSDRPLYPRNYHPGSNLMIATSSRGVDGFPSRSRRVDGRRMLRRIPNNRTLAPIGIKPCRLGDNPGPSADAASTRSPGTVGCSTAIFEVARPLDGINVEGPRLISSARGLLPTSQGLNRTPKSWEGSVHA